MPDFKPEDHPRDDQGKFTDGEGGNAGLAKWAEKKDPVKQETAAEKLARSRQDPMAGLFKPEELQGLPEWSRQQETDPDALFAQAKETHELQLSLLDRGSGLDKDIGASVIRGDKEGHDEFLKDVDKANNSTGPVVVIGPMKTQARSAEKANYWGGWGTVNDIVRATVAVDDIHQVRAVCDALRARGAQLAETPKNRFATPTDAGYRDLMLKVKWPNGHVSEVQVQLKEMLKAKEEAHGFYENTRSISAKIKAENRAMTPEETKTFNDSNAKMKSIYDAAWKKVNTPQAPKLRDDPYAYFTKPEGTKLVPIEKLNTIRARPEGIEHAEALMHKAAYEGGSKRKPISVKADGKGGYTVLDGNSTTAIARKHGWKAIPALESS